MAISSTLEALKLSMDTNFNSYKLNNGELTNREIELIDKTKTETMTVFDEARTIVDELLEGLQRWIASPQYDPDHPIGKAMIAAIKEDFDKVKESQTDPVD